MKLATIKNNTRDGQLVVVNKELTKAVKVPDSAMTMQQALENWQQTAPALQQVYQDLNQEKGDWFPFDPKEAMAPLPRAYQWLDGSAYVNHVELVRKARGVEMPENFWTDPLMYQGCSDALLGPCDDILCADRAFGIDFEAEIAVITDDVPMGVADQAAKDHIQLLMLVNDVSLRNLIPNEIKKGFGFIHGKPASAFSPVAVTPDELGNAWHEGKVHLPLLSHINDKLIGQPNAGVDMTFNFPTLIAHAAKTRQLAAGTILGSGTISNLDRSTGSSCLAEVRTLEKIAEGKPKTEFMNFGDRIKIEMLDEQGQSIFGAIDQQIIKS